MHNIFDKFLRPFCINSYYVKKFAVAVDLFKIIPRQMLGKIICWPLKGGKKPYK